LSITISKKGAGEGKKEGHVVMKGTKESRAQERKGKNVLSIKCG